jgi:hypothetical protein
MLLRATVHTQLLGRCAPGIPDALCDDGSERFDGNWRIDLEETKRFSDLAVFDARLYIRVCRIDELA